MSGVKMMGLCSWGKFRIAVSTGMTLDAGTIIATGTPAGVGAGFTPHRCMKTGDVCEIEVEGCGVLKNTVG